MPPFAPALALALLVLVGHSQARTLAEIRASNQLRVCVAGASADFYAANAVAFAQHLGVQAHVTRLAKWDEQFENAAGKVEREARYVAHRLDSGACDLYPNDLHLLDWRLTKMDLVPHYRVRKMVVAHQRLRASVKQPADLAGLRAAVQKGTSYDGWLEQQNATTYRQRPVVVEHHPTDVSVRRVSQGLADFTVTGSEGAFKWIRSGEYDNLDLLFPVDEMVAVGWGITPATPDLREALSAYFTDSLRVGSPLDRAWQNYYGISRSEYRFFEQSLDTTRAERAALRAWAVPAGAALGALGLATALWVGRLRRETRRHRETTARLIESQHNATQESAFQLAVSEIQLQLQQTDTLAAFGRTLLSELARRLPIAQALLCVAEGETLRAVARYAGGGDTAAATLEQAPQAASMLHESLRALQPRLIQPAGGLGLRIASGLGQADPLAVLIHPVGHGGQGIAVLELASFAAPDAQAQRLLHALTPFVAASLLRLLPAPASGQTPRPA